MEIQGKEDYGNVSFIPIRLYQSRVEYVFMHLPHTESIEKLSAWQCVAYIASKDIDGLLVLTSGQPAQE